MEGVEVGRNEDQLRVEQEEAGVINLTTSWSHNPEPSYESCTSTSTEESSSNGPLFKPDSLQHSLSSVHEPIRIEK